MTTIIKLNFELRSNIQVKIKITKYIQEYILVLLPIAISKYRNNIKNNNIF